jgi:hypothetical protein
MLSRSVVTIDLDSSWRKASGRKNGRQRERMEHAFLDGAGIKHPLKLLVNDGVD